MPRPHTSWECKFCGQIFSMEKGAKACEESHLHAEDLEIVSLRPHPHSKPEVYYASGAQFPTIVAVSNGTTTREYILAGTKLRRR